MRRMEIYLICMHHLLHLEVVKIVQSLNDNQPPNQNLPV